MVMARPGRAIRRGGAFAQHPAAPAEWAVPTRCLRAVSIAHDRGVAQLAGCPGSVYESVEGHPSTTLRSAQDAIGRRAVPELVEGPPHRASTDFAEHLIGDSNRAAEICTADTDFPPKKIHYQFQIALDIPYSRVLCLAQAAHRQQALGAATRKAEQGAKSAVET